MTLSIEFSSPFKDLIPEPQPAIQAIPQAYKNLPGIEKGVITAKKCIPFLDALTTGYIIRFPFDYRFTYNFAEQVPYFETNPNLPKDLSEKFKIGIHSSNQFNEELMDKGRTINGVLKFMNPWHIQTPAGYSCIFTQPFNRDLPFKIIDGVVDTDNFFSKVNLPFYWKSPLEKEIIIEAGSPMCLVIPFKRESWKMKITSKDEKREDRVNFFRKFKDNYKINSWSKKSYK